jgi:hypothetical protein
MEMKTPYFLKPKIKKRCFEIGHLILHIKIRCLFFEHRIFRPSLKLGFLKNTVLM